MKAAATRAELPWSPPPATLVNQLEAPVYRCDTSKHSMQPSPVCLRQASLGQTLLYESPGSILFPLYGGVRCRRKEFHDSRTPWLLISSLPQQGGTLGSLIFPPRWKHNFIFLRHFVSRNQNSQFILKGQNVNATPAIDVHVYRLTQMQPAIFLSPGWHWVTERERPLIPDKRPYIP